MPFGYNATWKCAAIPLGNSSWSICKSNRRNARCVPFCLFTCFLVMIFMTNDSMKKASLIQEDHGQFIRLKTHCIEHSLFSRN